MRNLVIATILFSSIQAIDTLIHFQDEDFIRQDSKKMITGYWENWNAPINPGPGSNADASYYAPDIKNINHFVYAFLTLAKNVHKPPADGYWDGTAIYESMTQDDIITTLTTSADNWMKVRILGMLDAVHQNGGKFIWAIGGYSDLKKFVKTEDIDKFVQKCVELLKQAGDGIDFDLEHLGDFKELTDLHTGNAAQVLYKLRKALDSAGMQDKQVGYTARYSYFFDADSQPKGWAYDDQLQQGLGLKINDYFKDKYSANMSDYINWYNIMFYDVSNDKINAAQGKNLTQFEVVLQNVAKYIALDKIVMGLEPGKQGLGGVWEGMDIDKQVIEQVKSKGYGGVMMWAMNHQANKPTGVNSIALAEAAAQAFSLNIQTII